MKLVLRSNPSLPPLAWCVSVRRGAGAATVTHGAWVEASGERFVEGAWSGEFGDTGFFERSFSGSGGCAGEGVLRLATSTHTLERIVSLRAGDTLFVSNSLAFALVEAEDDVDPTYALYDGRLASIKDGLRRYARSLPTLRGNLVRLHYHTNLRVTDDLEIREEPRPATRAFRDYADYVGFLREEVRAIAANAVDPGRAVRYTPICAMSAGYDSCAAAVLARSVGCREALTFRVARGSGDDSGRAVAERLGMEATELDRLDYLHAEGFPEAENSGGPHAFLAFEKRLPGRLLFVGYHGDKVWDRSCDSVSHDIVRGDASGASLTEFRLRAGFVTLPVAFLGCTSQASIHRISCSEELAPWRLGTDYDRPIARRLVEEAGVPRGTFALRKHAVGVVVSEEGLERTMKTASLEDFHRFSAPYWNWRFAARTGALRFVQSIDRWNRRLRRKLHKVAERRLGVDLRVPNVLPRRVRAAAYGYLGRESLLFHWGIRKVMERYRGAREEDASIVPTQGDIGSPTARN